MPPKAANDAAAAAGAAPPTAAVAAAAAVGGVAVDAERAAVNGDASDGRDVRDDGDDGDDGDNGDVEGTNPGGGGCIVEDDAEINLHTVATTQDKQQDLLTQPPAVDPVAGVSSSPAIAAGPAAGEPRVTRSSASSTASASAPASASFAAIPSALRNCTDDWKQKYVSLAAYYDQNGHCRVPYRGTRGKDPPKGLAQWVAEQRSAKDTLSPHQVQYLSSFGLWEVKAKKRSGRKTNVDASSKQANATQLQSAKVCISL